LRELNQAYLARCDANMRGPEFDGQRTKIPQSNRLHTVDDILRARGCPPKDDKHTTLPENILVAAVKMACDDATSPGWLRTRAQVYGGYFSNPVQLVDLSDCMTYLLEYDITMSKPSCKRVLEPDVAYEKARWELLPFRARIAITANRAQRHHFNNFFDDCYGLASLEDQSAKTMDLIRIAGEEMRPEATTLSPSATTSSRMPGIPATAPANQERLQKDQELPQDLAKVGHTYRMAGRDITTRLVTFLESKIESWTEGEQNKVKPMYSKAKPHEFGDYCWTSCQTFENAARKARELGWKMEDEVANWFITAITGRRKLRNWYDRLPGDDTRFKENDDHEAWLQTLINVVFALAGHQY
jgi:hypothetical protein